MLTEMLPPPSTAKPHQGEAGPPRPHAIVIGSGFGGLAAAIRLGARGYKVSVLERLDQPGGRANVFRQDGFTFDAGPTIITAPYLFEELWALCGKRMADDVTLKAMNPFYRLIFHDGSTMNCSGDPQAMRAEVMRLSPQDLAGYEKFAAASEPMFRVGFETYAHTPFCTLKDMVLAIPSLAGLRADRTLHTMVAKYVKDERLRIALSFHPLFIGGNPFSVTCVYALVIYLERRYGVHYAMGGTGELIKGMVSLVKGQGGRVKLKSDVTSILIEGGRAAGVRLANGETLRSDIVVSNACASFTYEHLVPSGTKKRWTSRKLASAHHSMGVFVWYFGTNRRYEDVQHHTILLSPRYRGLLDDIFKHKVLADDFSLYIHRPSASDPSVAPPGCDAFYVLSPVPNLLSGTDWTEEAEPYRQRIAAHIERKLLPGLSKAIVTSKLLTPLDFKERLLSFHGAAFGMEPILTQSAWFRPHNQSEGIKDLYLVGAGTHPGAGIPGVLSSARALDSLVPHATHPV